MLVKASSKPGYDYFNIVTNLDLNVKKLTKNNVLWKFRFFLFSYQYNKVTNKNLINFSLIKKNGLEVLLGRFMPKN